MRRFGLAEADHDDPAEEVAGFQLGDDGVAGAGAGELPRRAWAPVSPAARAWPAVAARRLRRALFLRTR